MPSQRSHSELLADRLAGPTGTTPGRSPRHPLSGWPSMSATHKRLLPEPTRIPYLRNPSDPSPSVCAGRLPANRGELPVSASPAAQVSTGDECAYGGSAGGEGASGPRPPATCHSALAVGQVLGPTRGRDGRAGILHPCRGRRTSVGAALTAAEAVRRPARPRNAGMSVRGGRHDADRPDHDGS